MWIVSAPLIPLPILTCPPELCIIDTESKGKAGRVGSGPGNHCSPSCGSHSAMWGLCIHWGGALDLGSMQTAAVTLGVWSLRALMWNSDSLWASQTAASKGTPLHTAEPDISAAGSTYFLEPRRLLSEQHIDALQ